MDGEWMGLGECLLGVERAIAENSNPVAGSKWVSPAPGGRFRSLMADLATLTRNTMAMADSPDATFLLYPALTPVQQRTFQLLDVPAQL
jgi:hypothetical protein